MRIEERNYREALHYFDLAARVLGPRRRDLVVRLLDADTHVCSAMAALYVARGQPDPRGFVAAVIDGRIDLDEKLRG